MFQSQLAGLLSVVETLQSSLDIAEFAAQHFQSLFVIVGSSIKLFVYQTDEP